MDFSLLFIDVFSQDIGSTWMDLMTPKLWLIMTFLWKDNLRKDCEWVNWVENLMENWMEGVYWAEKIFENKNLGFFDSIWKTFQVETLTPTYLSGSSPKLKCEKLSKEVFNRMFERQFNWLERLQEYFLKQKLKELAFI